MSQRNDPSRFIPAIAPDVLPQNCAPDHLAIFSGPGVEAVRHWWVESNRRWAERDRAKAVIVRANVEDVGQAVSVDSNAG